MITHTRGQAKASYDVENNRVLLEVKHNGVAYTVAFSPADSEGFSMARRVLLDKVTDNLPFDLLMAYGRVEEIACLRDYISRESEKKKDA